VSDLSRVANVKKIKPTAYTVNYLVTHIMTSQLLALPAPPRRLALPAPLKAGMSALLGTITGALKGEREKGTRVFFSPDDSAHLFTIGSAELGFSSMIIGTTRPGKSMLPAFVAASLASEKGRTKLVTVGGDDGLLAEFDAFSPVDWMVKWQSWFPTADNVAVPRIDVLEQSESGMLLAVDVAWTCQETTFRLQERFPQLTVAVTPR
jgi:hypothetical protein